MLIQCLDSAQFGSFISLQFRVLVHAKIFSLRTAEPSVHKKSSAVRKPFTLSVREWLIRSQTALLIPSNGLSDALVSVSALKRLKQINPTVSKLYPFIALQVEKENIIDMCNHNNHLAVDKNRKGYQFKRKLSIHSTIWPRSPLCQCVNRNGRHFDSVGCLPQVAPEVTDT